MKISKIISAVFAGLAVCAAAAGIFLSLRYTNAEPVLVEEPAAARERVVALMDAVCAGDYSTAGSLLYGQPDLGMDREAGDTVGVLFWNALEESRSYTVTRECYATDTGLALDVELRSLDLGSVTKNLRSRSQALLERRVAAAEDTSEVYVDGGDYREDFVLAVLQDAAAEALAEDSRMVDYPLTLHLVYDDGQWWIQPDAALMNAISGGFLK